MGVILIIIFVVLLLVSWPLVPGAVKKTDQDKRREAYQKRIKEEHTKRERQKQEDALEIEDEE